MSRGKHNAAIYLLSSRIEDLEECLRCLYKNWNNRHDYPVYVHHFDDIYSDNFISRINQNISKNIYFFQIDYGVPAHISEKELFYNRKYLEYVGKSFPRSRMGYLHMGHFVCNIHKFGFKGCLVKELEQYDYLMRIDDDSWFKENIEEDLFDYVQEVPIATAFMWNHCSQGHLDTREKLWTTYLKYLKEIDIQASDIKYQQLRNAVLADDEISMHTLKWTCGNLNIYNMKMLLSAGLDGWISRVNEYGGTYKHRWGDLEVLGLFGYTMFENPVCDLRLREKGLYQPKLPTSGFAPSVRNVKK
jgi:hypothetical protein